MSKGKRAQQSTIPKSSAWFLYKRALSFYGPPNDPNVPPFLWSPHFRTSHPKISKVAFVQGLHLLTKASGCRWMGGVSGTWKGATSKQKRIRTAKLNCSSLLLLPSKLLLNAFLRTKEMNVPRTLLDQFVLLLDRTSSAFSRCQTVKQLPIFECIWSSLGRGLQGTFSKDMLFFGDIGYLFWKTKLKAP